MLTLWSLAFANVPFNCFAPRVKKAHRCHCGKSYKTPQGLRTHTLTQHGAEALVKCSDLVSGLGSGQGHHQGVPRLHPAPLPVVSPTLQQHLLSPLVIRPSVASSFSSVSAEG